MARATDPKTLATEIISGLSGTGDVDRATAEDLFPVVYDELRRLAKGYMFRETPGHTLQPTALVHEAYAKLIDVEVTWQDRAHFYALAARMMRRLLVNHAKARNAGKRGGGARQARGASAVRPCAARRRIVRLSRARARARAATSRRCRGWRVRMW